MQRPEPAGAMHGCVSECQYREYLQLQLASECPGFFVRKYRNIGPVENISAKITIERSPPPWIEEKTISKWGVDPRSRNSFPDREACLSTDDNLQEPRCQIEDRRNRCPAG
jgi:hypothetical protein